MLLTADVSTLMAAAAASQSSPYDCPVEGCTATVVLETLTALRHHLLKFHVTSRRGGFKRKRLRYSLKKTRTINKSAPATPSKSGLLPSGLRVSPSTCLSYEEAQRLVEFDTNGHKTRISIFEPLEVKWDDDVIDESEISPGTAALKKASQTLAASSLARHREAGLVTKLPEAQYSLVENSIKLAKIDKLTNEYVKYQERTPEMLDKDVEYDMDEQDIRWLEIINFRREVDGLTSVTTEEFELLLDRLEKECIFDSQPHSIIESEAVCCVCADGECSNTNVILFCDLCNLPVHQECYGVPYVPEGQWLCRRCLESPSTPVSCVLCPNRQGAFKRTDTNQWAHVACALWVPEVQFANPVFLEPIDSVERVPAARWKLTCYICGERGSGACVQCQRQNCFVAFHVTCGLQAGLHMKLEAGSPSNTPAVKKTAFCDLHTPADSDRRPRVDSSKPGKRKLLAARRQDAAPQLILPRIPDNAIAGIIGRVNFERKSAFINKLISYWLLKRQARNGVPLIRRLQAAHWQSRPHNEAAQKAISEMKEQLRWWKRLRQGLEKARLLCELIKKRERLKKELIILIHDISELELSPFYSFLSGTLASLKDKDTSNFFKEPVDIDAVTDYLTVIDEPLCFKDMQRKIEEEVYTNFEEFDNDFFTIIENCLRYNNKDTVFYKAALKLREAGGQIIRKARRFIQSASFTQQHPAFENFVNQQKNLDLKYSELVNPDKRKHLSLRIQLLLIEDALDLMEERKYTELQIKLLKREAKSIKRIMANERESDVQSRLKKAVQSQFQSPVKSPLAEVKSRNIGNSITKSQAQIAARGITRKNRRFVNSQPKVNPTTTSENKLVRKRGRPSKKSLVDGEASKPPSTPVASTPTRKSGRPSKSLPPAPSPLKSEQNVGEKTPDSNSEQTITRSQRTVKKRKFYGENSDSEDDPILKKVQRQSAREAKRIADKVQASLAVNGPCNDD